MARLAWPLWGVLGALGAAAALAAPVGLDRYDYDGAGRLIRHVDAAQQVTEYRHDPAGNILGVGSAQADALKPALNGLSPAVLRRGERARLTLTGERLQSGTLSASHPGLAISRVERSASALGFDLAVAADTPVGPQRFTYANSLGSAQIGFEVAPGLPVVSVEPSPLALPPDGVARPVWLRLSNADAVAHTLTLGSSDTGKGSVSPASLTLAAGQTSALISVTGRSVGYFALQIGSATLAPASVPVFVTVDFRGASTSHAPHVGVRVGDKPPVQPRTAQGLFGARGVGVAVGSVLTQVAPSGASVGSTVALSLQGRGLPEGAQLAVVPDTGARVWINSASRERIEATLELQPDAPTGWRRLELRSAAGQPVPQASPEAGLIRITSGQPEVLSLTPLFSERGRVATLTVQGRHLQHGRLRLTPGTDLRVEAEPQVSADGRTLTARVEIAPLAATGPRTVQVLTPSGESSAEPGVANQFTLVSEVRESLTPIASALVGVRVGEAPATAGPTATGPVLARAGVLVGAGATGLSPRAGVVGTELLLEVGGHGLQAVQSASLWPAEGLTLGAPSSNAEGTRLSLPLQVAADAPRGPRRLVLATASGAVPFTLPGADRFEVVAPVPELLSITPQVWPAGQSVAVSVRGRHLLGVSGVELSPPAGISVSNLNASADGSSLSFTAQVAADAPNGVRGLIVSTTAGRSSEALRPGNTVQVVQTAGASLTPIASSLVGVQVGAPPAPVNPSLPYLLNAARVGVTVNTVPAPQSRSETPHARAVGVLVGPGALSLSPASPDGLLKGSSGSVVLRGHGLGAVTRVLSTQAGVSAGAPVANAEGTQLVVPLSVAADAPSGAVGLSLLAGEGGPPLPVVGSAALSLHVGALPSAQHSVSPIVLEQGKRLTLTVRGEGLRDVFAMEFEPAAGIAVGPGGARLQWESDGFGEKLSVPIAIEADAPLGPRVLRLRVPGALSSGEPVPANTLEVVAPQQ